MTLGGESRGGAAPLSGLSSRRTGQNAPGIAEVNLALLGSLGVGKSALTVKYITKRFISEYDPDLEDTYSKMEILDHQDVLVKIMDTCDKEHKDAERYLKWADAFLVVYSITSRPSFEQAQQHLEIISQQDTSISDCPVVLVGNKVDMERYRQVSKAEGNSCAMKFEATFFETTAAEDYDDVEKVFRETLRLVLREQDRYTPLKALYINEEKISLNPNRVGNRIQKINIPSTRLNATARERKLDDRGIGLSERNPKFKLFNKGFKIFQS